MVDLIDRDALKDALAKRVPFAVVTSDDAAFAYGLDAAYVAVQNAPTIDPVRHARWARKDNSKNCKRIGDFEEWYECSACEGNAGDKSAYCPDCGARMDADAPERAGKEQEDG